jgi:hypothetical protein
LKVAPRGTPPGGAQFEEGQLPGLGPVPLAAIMGAGGDGLGHRQVQLVPAEAKAGIRIEGPIIRRGDAVIAARRQVQGGGAPLHRAAQQGQVQVAAGVQGERVAARQIAAGRRVEGIRAREDLAGSRRQPFPLGAEFAVPLQTGDGQAPAPGHPPAQVPLAGAPLQHRRQRLADPGGEGLDLGLLAAGHMAIRARVVNWGMAFQARQIDQARQFPQPGDETPDQVEQRAVVARQGFHPLVPQAQNMAGEIGMPLAPGRARHMEGRGAPEAVMVGQHITQPMEAVSQVGKRDFAAGHGGALSAMARVWTRV